MGLIASATGILLVPGESRTPGVLYAFDDTIVAAFFSETWKQKRSFRLTKSDALEELDALPRESVTIEDVVSRSDRGAWVLPISNIAKVVLSRSKFVGVVLGLSLIKIDSTHDDVKPLYARRDATESVAALLANALGDRFENRRIARART